MYPSLLTQRLAPLVLAIILFGLNNLAILSGWLSPPVGFSSILLIRAPDTAQYWTWSRALENSVLATDYNAPWLTPPGLFSPFALAIARASGILHLEFPNVYLLFHFLFYILAAYALFFTVRTFTETRRQSRTVWLVILFSLPLTSLALLPALIVPHDQWQPLPPVPGLGDFVWWSSDGFFHGISGSALVTFGTATTLLTFSFLARFLQTERTPYLLCSACTVFISALVHPFEVFVIITAGVVTLALWRGKIWQKSIPEIVCLTFPGALGLAPYIYLTWRYEWVRDAAALNHWVPESPLRMLAALGLPTILVLVSLVMHPTMDAPQDKLLRNWFLFSLIGIYVPVIPWSQHLLDGFIYVTALLFVRRVLPSSIVSWVRNRYPRLAVNGLGLIVMLGIAAYLAYYLQAWRDGRSVQPELLVTSVASHAELSALSWMRQNAQPDQLVLAPAESAPWFATVPMHSFASHFIFSLTYNEQSRFSDEFYRGELDISQAYKLLSDYGVRYVVVPDSSPASKYMTAYSPKAKFDHLAIYQLDGTSLKPYGTLADREFPSGLP